MALLNFGVILYQIATKFAFEAATKEAPSRRPQARKWVGLNLKLSQKILLSRGGGGSLKNLGPSNALYNA